MNDMTPSKVYEFLKQFSESLEEKAKKVDPETRVLISYANVITTVDKLQSDDLEHLAFIISADSKYDTCLRSMITETRQCVYNGFGGYVEYDGEQIDVDVAYTISDVYNFIIIHIDDSFNRLVEGLKNIYKAACNTKFEFNDGTEEEQLEPLGSYGYFDHPANEPLKPIFADIEGYCNDVCSQQEVHDKFIEQQYVAQGKICRIMHDPDGLLTKGDDSDEFAEEIFEENAQGDEA